MILGYDTPLKLAPSLPPVLPNPIWVYYRTIDRFSESRRFKTLKGARAYVRKRIGDTFDVGGNYAVDAYGVGKVTANIPMSLLMGVEG